MTKDKALSVEDTLKLALEALYYTTNLSKFLLKNEANIGPMLKADEAITAIKEVLMSVPDGAQPEQEPTRLWCETCKGTGKVYQEHQAGCHVGGRFKCPDCDGEGYIFSRLYSTTPPQRKPLTDEQLQAVWEPLQNALCLDYKVFARDIEAAHGIKEKNT